MFGVLLLSLPVEIIYIIDDFLIESFRRKNARRIKNVFSCVEVRFDRLYVGEYMWMFEDDYCRVCGEKRRKLYNCIIRNGVDVVIRRCKC